MSAQDTPGRSGENKPEGLSKYIRRMKTVLRSRSDKRSSMPSKAASSAPPKPVPAAVGPTVMSDYGTIQHEKARALFAKYGLTLEPGEWKSPPEVPLQWVTKPIRMRVRRTCHRCQTTFGPDKVCVNCQHPRCKNCPRFPPAHSNDESGPPVPKHKIAEIITRQRLAQPITPHIRITGDPTAPLAKPSRTPGQELVRKPVRQRVRRHCHQCGTLFASGTKECETCKHVRCKRCPRDPAKRHKHTDGYPGDVEHPRPIPTIPNRTWKRPRRRYRWMCHVCSSAYREGASTCWKCGQGKCGETIREPPKRVTQEFDPKVVQRVEERLAALAS